MTCSNVFILRGAGDLVSSLKTAAETDLPQLGNSNRHQDIIGRYSGPCIAVSLIGAVGPGE